MSRNFTIDLIRLIAAFCIVTLHTNSPILGHDTGSIIRLSGRWAVPFFFITSGFFLGKKIINNKKLHFVDIEINVLNLISIFIISSLVYLIHGTLFSCRWFTNDVGYLLNGAYWHLWFIGSMMFGFIVIWYFYSIKFEKYLLFTSIIIILIAVLSDSYDQLFGKEIDYNQIPRFLTSIPFMYTGVF